jgi:hypothetical protein
MRADRAVATVAAALSALGLAACGGSSGGEPEGNAAKLETIHGQQRVVLSRDAVERIGLRTAIVRSGNGRDGIYAIPYSALLYTASGKPFTYVEVGPRAYARRSVQVARLTSSEAFLSSGPPPGAAVVTLGGEELNGTETGVQQPE